MFGYHPEEEYTQWLQRCRAQSGDLDVPLLDGQQLEFLEAPELMVLDYVQHCRTNGERPIPQGAGLPPKEFVARKYNTIKSYKAGIASTHSEMGLETDVTNTARIARQMNTYEEVDDESCAVAFDMEADTPKLFDAVWSLIGWSMLTRIRCWAMFLVGCCICARASDLTTFCPLLQTMKLPPRRKWDKDGLPSYIILHFLYPA